MKVDYKQALIAAKQLWAQKTMFSHMMEELDSIEHEIQTLSEMEEVLRQIHRCQKETEAHGRTIGQMADSLTLIVQIYQTAERKIQDAYMQERILYPRQSIGINQIRCCPYLSDKVKIIPGREDGE